MICFLFLLLLRPNRDGGEFCFYADDTLLYILSDSFAFFFLLLAFSCYKHIFPLIASEYTNAHPLHPEDSSTY